MRISDHCLIGFFGLLILAFAILCFTTGAACLDLIEGWSCTRQRNWLGVSFLALLGLGVWALADLTGSSTFSQK